MAGKDEAVYLRGGWVPQPRAQRSELFLLCVLFVLCVSCASQMPHQCWVGTAAERGLDVATSVGVCWCVHHQRCVGRAAERCLDATSSVVCDGVGVYVPKWTTSAGLAGQPNGAWMLLAV